MPAVQETGPFEVVSDTRIWFRHLRAATPYETPNARFTPNTANYQ